MKEIQCKHCKAVLKSDTPLAGINHMCLCHPELLFQQADLALVDILKKSFEISQEEQPV